VPILGISFCGCGRVSLTCCFLFASSRSLSSMYSRVVSTTQTFSFSYGMTFSCMHWWSVATVVETHLSLDSCLRALVRHRRRIPTTFDDIPMVKLTSQRFHFYIDGLLDVCIGDLRLWSRLTYLLVHICELSLVTVEVPRRASTRSRRSSRRRQHFHSPSRRTFRCIVGFKYLFRPSLSDAISFCRIPNTEIFPPPSSSL
jgi:hypothetical protein